MSHRRPCGHASTGSPGPRWSDLKSPARSTVLSKAVPWDSSPGGSDPRRACLGCILAHQHTRPEFSRTHLEDCPASARVTPSCHVGGGGLAIAGRRAPQNPCLGGLERARRIRGSECRLGSWRTRHFNSVFDSSPIPPVVLILLVSLLRARPTRRRGRERALLARDDREHQAEHPPAHGYDRRHLPPAVSDEHRLTLGPVEPVRAHGAQPEHEREPPQQRASGCGDSVAALLLRMLAPG